MPSSVREGVLRFLLAVAGFSVVLFAPVRVVELFVVPDWSSPGLVLPVGLAVPVAVAFRRRGGSLLRLAEFVVALVVAEIVAGFVLMALFALVPAPGVHSLQVGLVAVVYGVAYYVVYADGFSRHVIG